MEEREKMQIYTKIYKVCDIGSVAILCNDLS